MIHRPGATGTGPKAPTSESQNAMLLMAEAGDVNGFSGTWRYIQAHN